MSLNVGELGKEMLGAVKGSLSESWPGIKDFAEVEVKKLAQGIVSIEKMYLQGKIDKKTSKLLLNIHKNAMQTVLLTVEGMGIIAVEKAINAALKVAKDGVNSALGFALI
jgi:hypothetical protein